MKLSTFRELLGVLRCLQALVHLCIGDFAVVQVDSQHLLGIINRGSTKLAINKFARDLFLFHSSNGINLFVECGPREENAFADKLSKLRIPDDTMLAPKFFDIVEARWAPHTVDLLDSSDNTKCEKFYSLRVWMSGGICRYNDVSRLRWHNLQFDEGGEFAAFRFERRKNSQFRQGDTIYVSAIPRRGACIL